MNNKMEFVEMSYADLAYYVLSENNKKMKIQDLFKKVIELKQLPENFFESKIADFFGIISTDKRFVMVDKGFWDLSEKNVKKIVIDSEEDEEEEIIIEDIEEENELNENIEDEIYDDDTVDDDDDDLKDLVIIDDSDENDLI